MSKHAKILSAIVAIIMLFSALTPIVSAADVMADALSVSAKAAVLIDASSNRILYSKNADARLPMASTTKIMTALVALELGDPDQSYIIPDKAVGVEGSSIYLVKGERLTLRELIYALMLESANDAAEAIAIIIAGSVEAFADIMNQRAAELGLENTHFENPHGLDHQDHYTTAYELAKLTSFALRNDAFREIVSTNKKTIPFNNGESARLLVNHNKMLRTYQGAIGVKTGFTKRCGRCLVSAAERDGLTLVAVTLNAPDDWRDHTAMLNWGFDNFVRMSPAAPGEFKLALPVSGGTDTYALCANTTQISATLPRNHGALRCVVEAPRFLLAPAKCGEAVGRVVYYFDGDVLGESPLCIITDVERKETKKGFWAWLTSIFSF